MAFSLDSWYGNIIIPGYQMLLMYWTTEQHSWGKIMLMMMMLGCTDVLCFTMHLNSKMLIPVKLEFWLEVCKYTINILFSLEAVFVWISFYCLFQSFFMLYNMSSFFHIAFSTFPLFAASCTSTLWHLTRCRKNSRTYIVVILHFISSLE